MKKIQKIIIQKNNCSQIFKAPRTHLGFKAELPVAPSTLNKTKINLN